VELDLRYLLRVAKRRGWIAFLIMVLIGGTVFLLTLRQDAQYSASARIVVLAGQGASESEYNSLLASRSLAETYRLLIETGPVLDRVIDTLKLQTDATELDKKVSTSVVGETQIIEVSVEDRDPREAARIATTIVEQFRLYIHDQVDSRIGAQVEVADPARVPTEPFEPRPLAALVLGLLAGLMVGVGVVVLVEYLDNTVKPERGIPDLAGAPVLASISDMKLSPGAGQIYTLNKPQSSGAEALRLLRTNLEFAAAAGTINRLVITSPGPGEGKSTIVANLGIVMAQAGRRTVVIDADLRRPTQSGIFQVPNTQGLSTLLANPEMAWSTVVKDVGAANLMLIPSGPLPPNPSDLLSSARFEELLERIGTEVDLIIVDSPPVLSASDSLAIAGHADGIVIVCRSHSTRIEALEGVTQAVRQGGIRLIGVVLNRLKGQQHQSYYGEYVAREHVVSEAPAGD
jgi:receptor protein-tyrosine kinase